MILLSGGFDPLHVGHVRMIRDAHARFNPRSYASILVIALNSDDWLIRKKGYVFMPWEERKEILEALGLSVVRVDDADNTVCEALTRVRPDYFGNGGDRTTSNPYEHEVCVRLGITEVFGLGGGKAQSSSDLLGNFIHNWNNM